MSRNFGIFRRDGPVWPPEDRSEALSEDGAVWIFSEADEAGVSRSTLGLLSVAKQLAAIVSKKLSSVFIGANIKDAAEQCLHLGPDHVYLCEHSSYAEYDGDLFAQTLETICRKYQPDILLAAHTATGQDLLPRLAARLDTQIVTDCIDLAIDQGAGALLMTKPVYGGNAVAVFASASFPQLATVRARGAKTPLVHPDKKAELIQVDFAPSEDAGRVKHIQNMAGADGLRLEDAEIVVAGGRGIGGPDGFAALHELAAVLGGAVGASRPPCDNGWTPPQIQIGLTGKAVAPKLYFAVAISGMMQHIMGMFESGRIVAINKDKDAPIFKTADYGVVGDYREALPPFIQKLKQLRRSQEQKVV